MKDSAREKARKLADLTPLQRATFSLMEKNARIEALESERSAPVSILGMGCRFPGGANSPAALWDLLRNGIDAISEVPADRWNVNELYDPDPEAPGKVSSRCGGFIDGVDRFDAELFGIMPKEARSMDPQQRLLLEVAWQALENAGISPRDLRGSRTGIFVGIATQDYAHLPALDQEEEIDGYVGTGTAFSFAAGRLSYIFGCEGPSVALDTACSASLSAVHLAIQSLRLGECDLAVAGGVNAILSPKVTIYTSKIGAMAKDGRCKTFDARADGYVRGEGCGLVVLKRQKDALADGDPIVATLRGSAMNQDGRSSGLTAPNGPSQQAVVREALKNARVEPATIRYVEAHGTGTPLGDPIEAQALGSVLAEGRPESRLASLGSIKTNFGHLEAAAGIAGLMKTALALQHRQIPPSLHFQKANPHIPFASLPLEVQTELGPWPDGEGPLRAGVSSFGFSGTNVHVVMEEAPERAEEPPVSRAHHLFCLSAQTAQALERLHENFVEHLERNPDLDLEAVAQTLQLGRQMLRFRRALVVSNLGEGVERCRAEAGRTVARSALELPALVFELAAPEVLEAPVGRELYAGFEVFRTEVDRACSLLGEEPGRRIRRLFGNGAEGEQATAPERSMAGWVAELALARLLLSLKLRPAAWCGDGPGELGAVHLAGVLDLESAVAVVWAWSHNDLDGAAEQLRETKLRTPRHGLLVDPGRQKVSEDEATDPELWISRWFRSGSRAPRPNDRDRLVLRAMVRGLEVARLAADEEEQPIRSVGELERFLELLGELWQAGGTLDWSALYRGEPRRRVMLPTYPFERRRHWLSESTAAESTAAESTAAESTAAESTAAESTAAAVVNGSQSSGVAAPAPAAPAAIAAPVPVGASPASPGAGLDLTAIAMQQLAAYSQGFTRLVQDQLVALYGSGSAQAAPVAPPAPAEPAVAPAPELPSVVPLTAVQRQLWVVAELDEDAGPAYNIPFALDLHGPLEVETLRAALADLTARHAGLRVVIEPGGEQQRILETLEAELPIAELPSTAPRVEDDPEIMGWLATEGERAFEMTGEPLFRFHLLRLDPQRHVFVFTAHHILLDGWSMVLAVEELLAFYVARLAGQDAGLPNPMQLPDYVSGLEELARSEAMAGHEEYWVREFSGELPVLELPTDRPRPPWRTFRGVRTSPLVSAELSAALKEVGKSRGATLFMTLLAVYGAWLYRLTGQEEVVVGIPTAGRGLPGSDKVMACCASMLPLRLWPRGDATFAEILAETRAQLVQAYNHQDYPLGRLVEKLQVRRDPSRPLVFSTTFNLDILADPPPLGDLRLQLVSPPVRYTDHEISLNVIDHNGELLLDFDANADLFEPSTLERWQELFTRLLEAVVEAPDRPLYELPILEESEQSRILGEWSGTFPEYPRRGLAELFAEQVAKNPNAVALEAADERWTYRELEDLSLRMARQLHGAGVVRETLVGLFLDDSVDMVIGTLAVLQAGGAYVPLDPANPEERLAFVMEDTAMPVVVTTSRWVAHLPVSDRAEGSGPTVLCLDRSELEDDGDGACRVVEVDSSSLAHVIYTSGSTGRPKGVAIPQHAVARLVRSTDYAQLGPDDRVAQVANASFDAATFEIWSALLNGACLVVVPKHVVLSPADLELFLRRHEISALLLTTSLFNHVASERPTAFAGLRYLLFGGEAADPAAARRVLAAGPPERLLNAYGPTENGVISTCYPVQEVAPGVTTVPIGGAIANTRILVVGRHGEPVSVGVVGELLVGGEGLARGYLRRPSLTAELFVPDALGGLAGERLYRTGDLVRWREDGTLEFVGRRDHQVKVRGFRIELGEVEAALSELPIVRESVVVAPRDSSGARRLVAYVVAADPRQAETTDLRGELREMLPDFMVPSVIQWIDQLPLNANGKVDVKRLPDPTSTVGGEQTPGNQLESSLATIWCEVLEIDRVAVDADFFELGGHSLLATRAVSRIRRELGIEISLRDLFDAPTVARLARRLSGSGGSVSAVDSIERSEEKDHGPLSFAQERLWFFARLAPDEPVYNIPALLRIEGQLSAETLEASLLELVQRHEALRTTFPTVGRRPQQQIQAPRVDWTMEDLSGLDPDAREAREESVREKIEALAASSFDLARGPLARFHLLRLDQEEHLLLVLLHHIIADGWSFGVLFRELEVIYRARQRGVEARLPDLPIRYLDFATWQRRHLQGPELERQLDFWRRELDGAPPVLELPTDRPRPAVQTYRGEAVYFHWSGDLASRLQRLSQERGTTLFTVLMAGFQSLLAHLSGRRDLVVGTAVANRNRSELEGLVGFFVNMVALRAKLDGSTSFAELLEHAHDRSLAAQDHQDLPFEKLVDELQPERSLATSPIFQVAMTLEDRSALEPRLPGLRVTFEKLSWRGSKFDLSLLLVESEEGLEGAVEFNVDLFDLDTVERWVAHYRTLLAAAVDAPDTAVEDLPSLTPSQQAQILGEGIEAPLAEAETLFLDRFRAWAEEAPDTAAVVCGDHAVSYGELHRRSVELGAELRQMGVGPDVLVAVALDRSPELLVALLGVLEAGGAYLPLDPEYPDERLAYMLDTAAPVVALTRESLRGRLPDAACPVLCVDGERPTPEAAASTGSGPETYPDHIAYVIFTSGSTGQPKGVLVPHGGYARLCQAQAQTFGIAAGDRVLQFSSISFDASVFEMAMALAAGATLELPQSGQLLLGRALEETLDRTRTRIATLPPSALASLRPSQLPALTTLTVAGEACSAELVDRWAPSRRFFNLYGPTEATIWATSTECRAGMGTPSIGRPIPGARAHVLDRRLRVLPLGIPGELCLGGPLARGYLARPELTAVSFVPDPFSERPGERLYRTGDLVRRLPGGEIEFLGRIDHQVKIRGFRIEPGEIEVALGAHPRVAKAAVMARQDGGPERRLVAYVVLEGSSTASSASESSVDAAGLRAWLRERLPEHLVPALVVFLDALPLTQSGKVDRSALPAPEPVVASEATFQAPRGKLERQLAEIWKAVLGVDQVGLEDNFFDLGGSSLLLVEVHEELSSRLALELPLVDLFQYPTLRALAEHVRSKATLRRPVARVSRRVAAPDAAIAIVGLSGRFPDAPDLDALWRNLCDGVESVSFFSEEELIENGLDREMIERPGYVRARSLLDGIDLFDAPFFGFSPREAQLLDPQRRIFLEEVWTALEHAGYSGAQDDLRVGVFAGASASPYAMSAMLSGNGDPSGMLLNNNSTLTTLVSYKLNLKGPSYYVDTACSTSLVAVHMACQNLRDGDTDLAIAGGVSAMTPQKMGHLYQPDGAFSPDGHCRAFDAQAGGTVGGSGVGVVVLKRLDEALAEGDTIHAVIRGSAVNNDGSDKVGFTAPSVGGQVEVIREALEMGEVDPETIAFVETHGTATPLGDPIEIAALTQAYRQSTDRRGYCGVGSIKTNLGHLDAAAGVAGLIKAVLSLRQRQLPPSLHFESPNPRIDFDSSPFFVNDELRPLRTDDGPLRAGVSAFGVGGTNAHVVLEAPAAPEHHRDLRSLQLLTISARTEEALERSCDRLAEHLASEPEQELSDIAYTLQVGRQRFDHRRILVADSAADAAQVLLTRDHKRLLGATGSSSGRELVFMFPGGGTQYVGMGRELYETEEEFRRWIDHGAERVEPLLGLDLRSVMYGDPQDAEANAGIRTASIALAALFSTEYALAKLLLSWGFEPKAMIGHSLGEYVAACLAGVFTFEDALAVVTKRGQLGETLPAGSMLSVPLPEAEVRQQILDGLSIAAINAPNACLLSGAVDTVTAMEKEFAEQGVETQRIAIGGAGHSQQIEPILEEFTSFISALELRPPSQPYVSNVTGRWIEAEEATDPLFWTRHLRHTVRFADGIGCLLEDPDRVYVEVGPGNALSTLTKRCTDRDLENDLIPSLRHPRHEVSDVSHLLQGIGRLWLAGVEVDHLARHWSRGGRRVPLPTYPFERKSYWLDHKLGAGIPLVRPESATATESASRKRVAEASSRDYLAPRNDAEATLAEIWQEVLGAERVGVEDNFFELGGSSLIGLQIATRAGEAGLTFSAKHLFEHQTIAALALSLGAGPDMESSGAEAASDGAPAPEAPAAEAEASPATEAVDSPEDFPRIDLSEDDLEDIARQLEEVS